MPRPWEMKEKFDLITADFTYVRWLGNRKEIEEQTTTWDKTIIDRTGDLKIAGEQHQSLAVGNIYHVGVGCEEYPAAPVASVVSVSSRAPQPAR